MANKLYTSIYETKDYSKFKKLPANRDAKTMGKIVDSIERVGYVLSPILVNEKFEVIDGQNRLLALKELGLPVHYMIQPGLGIRECRSLNIGQSNWNTRQFIDSYAEEGNENYVRLKSLLDDYGGTIGVEGIVFTAYPKFAAAIGGGIGQALRKGTFEMNEAGYNATREKLQRLIDLGYAEFFKKHGMTSRSWWGACAYALAHPRVDMKTLINRLNKDPLSVVACARVEDQLGYFDEAYNKGRVATSRVFMKTDFLSGKYFFGERK